MKKIFSISFLILFCLANKMNSQNWQWAKGFGGVGYDESAWTCLDAAGNIYAAGYFTSPQLIFGADTLTLNGNSDIFFVKYSSNGNFVWAKRAGSNDGMASIGDNGGFVEYESSSNSIITAVTMDGNSGTVGTCNLGTVTKGIVLSKLDVNGNCIWAIKGDQMDFQWLTLDNLGNIYVSGRAAFNTGFGSVIVPQGVFLAKFNSSSGACNWVKHIMDVADVNSDHSEQIKYFNGNLYLGGKSSNDTLHLDTATAFCNVNDCFISKFDTSGNIKWLRTMGGKGNDFGGNLSLDGSGNIYTSGLFHDTIFFGTNTLTNGNNFDVFLAKYDNNGSFVWAKQTYSTSGFISPTNTSTDVNGNTYLTGTFSGVASFGSNTLTASTSSDMFVARYDSNGSCLGAVTVGNVNFSEVLGDPSGTCYITGSLINTANFGGNALTSAGSRDGFLAKLDAITGINNLKQSSQNNQLLIYANPSQGKCKITVPDDLLNENKLTLSIFNNEGKLIQQKVLEMNDGKINVNIEQEAKGIYNVTLSGKGKIYNGKIIFE